MKIFKKSISFILVLALFASCLNVNAAQVNVDGDSGGYTGKVSENSRYSVEDRDGQEPYGYRFRVVRGRDKAGENRYLGNLIDVYRGTKPSTGYLITRKGNVSAKMGWATTLNEQGIGNNNIGLKTISKTTNPSSFSIYDKSNLSFSLPQGTDATKLADAFKKSFENNAHVQEICNLAKTGKNNSWSEISDRYLITAEPIYKVEIDNLTVYATPTDLAAYLYVVSGSNEPASSGSAGNVGWIVNPIRKYYPIALYAPKATSKVHGIVGVANKRSDNNFSYTCSEIIKKSFGMGIIYDVNKYDNPPDNPNVTSVTPKIRIKYSAHTSFKPIEDNRAYDSESTVFRAFALGSSNYPRKLGTSRLVMKQNKDGDWVTLTDEVEKGGSSITLKNGQDGIKLRYDNYHHTKWWTIDADGNEAYFDDGETVTYKDLYRFAETVNEDKKLYEVTLYSEVEINYLKLCYVNKGKNYSHLSSWYSSNGSQSWEINKDGDSRITYHNDTYYTYCYPQALGNGAANGSVKTDIAQWGLASTKWEKFVHWKHEKTGNTFKDGAEIKDIHKLFGVDLREYTKTENVENLYATWTPYILKIQYKIHDKFGLVSPDEYEKEPSTGEDNVGEYIDLRATLKNKSYSYNTDRIITKENNVVTTDIDLHEVMENSGSYSLKNGDTEFQIRYDYHHHVGWYTCDDFIKCNWRGQNKKEIRPSTTLRIDCDISDEINKNLITSHFFPTQADFENADGDNDGILLTTMISMPYGNDLMIKYKYKQGGENVNIKEENIRFKANSDSSELPEGITSFSLNRNDNFIHADGSKYTQKHIPLVNYDTISEGPIGRWYKGAKVQTNVSDGLINFGLESTEGREFRGWELSFNGQVAKNNGKNLAFMPVNFSLRSLKQPNDFTAEEIMENTFGRKTLRTANNTITLTAIANWSKIVKIQYKANNEHNPKINNDKVYGMNSNNKMILDNKTNSVFTQIINEQSLFFNFIPQTYNLYSGFNNASDKDKNFNIRYQDYHHEGWKVTEVSNGNASWRKTYTKADNHEFALNEQEAKINKDGTSCDKIFEDTRDATNAYIVMNARGKGLNKETNEMVIGDYGGKRHVLSQDITITLESIAEPNKFMLNYRDASPGTLSSPFKWINNFIGEATNSNKKDYSFLNTFKSPLNIFTANNSYKNNWANYWYYNENPRASANDMPGLKEGSSPKLTKAGYTLVGWTIKEAKGNENKTLFESQDALEVLNDDKDFFRTSSARVYESGQALGKNVINAAHGENVLTNSNGNVLHGADAVWGKNYKIVYHSNDVREESRLFYNNGKSRDLKTCSISFFDTDEYENLPGPTLQIRIKSPEDDKLNFKRDYYRFEYWRTSRDNDNSTKLYIGNIRKTSDIAKLANDSNEIHLYAVWTPVTINFKYKIVPNKNFPNNEKLSDYEMLDSNYTINNDGYVADKSGNPITFSKNFEEIIDCSYKHYDACENPPPHNTACVTTICDNSVLKRGADGSVPFYYIFNTKNIRRIKDGAIGTDWNCNGIKLKDKFKKQENGTTELLSMTGGDEIWDIIEADATLNNTLKGGADETVNFTLGTKVEVYQYYYGDRITSLAPKSFSNQRDGDVKENNLNIYEAFETFANGRQLNEIATNTKLNDICKKANYGDSEYDGEIKSIELKTQGVVAINIYKERHILNHPGSSRYINHIIYIKYNSPPAFVAKDTSFIFGEIEKTDLENMQHTATDAEDGETKNKSFISQIINKDNEYVLNVTKPATEEELNNAISKLYPGIYKVVHVAADSQGKKTTQYSELRVFEKTSTPVNKARKTSRYISRNYFPLLSKNIKLTVDENNELYFPGVKKGGVVFYALVNGKASSYRADACLKATVDETSGECRIYPTSKWYTNDDYSEALKETLNNKKTGNEWNHNLVKFSFKNEDVKKLRKEILSKGLQDDFWSSIKDCITDGGVDNKAGTATIEWDIDESGTLTIDTADTEAPINMPDYSIDNPAPWSDSTFYDVKFGNKIKNVGAYAFYNNKTITSITLPKGCAKIYESAFENCTKLKTVKQSAGDTTSVNISNRAFYNCYSLQKFAFNTKYIQRIGDYAFYNCSALGGEGYVFPLNKNGSVGEYAFWNCQSLDEIRVSGTMIVSDFSFGNCINLKPSGTLDGISSYLVPAPIWGKWAFVGCNSIDSVDFRTSNSTLDQIIDVGVFAHCKNLKQIRPINNKTMTTKPMAFFKDTKPFYGVDSIPSPNGTATINIPNNKLEPDFLSFPVGKVTENNTSIKIEWEQ